MEGAQTTIFCAVDESLDKTSGKYYKLVREQAPNKLALDNDLCRRVYDVTLRAIKDYV